jgi:hypothetical protein
MIVSARKTWLYGCLAVLAIDALWGGVVMLDLSPPQAGMASVVATILYLAPQILPVVSAFFVALFSPRWKIILGLSMAFLHAIFIVLVNATAQNFGHHVDFAGLDGAFIYAKIILLFYVPLCTLGAVFGYIIALLISEHPKK